MTSGSWLLIISRFFERSSFYLLIGVIFNYLLTQPIYLTAVDAFFYYSFFLVIVAGANVVGGVLGDLLVSNRTLLFIGYGLNLTGLTLLYAVAFETWYLPLAIAGLGTGLYGPNLMALFAKEYKDRQAKPDTGFTLLFAVTHLATMIAGFVWLALMGRDYHIFLIACQVLMTLSVLPLFFLPRKTANAIDAELPGLPYGLHVFWIVAALVIPSLALMAFSLPTNYLSDLMAKPQSASTGIQYDVSDFISQLTVIISAGLAWFWSRKYLSPLYKITAGLLLGGIATFIPLLAAGPVTIFVYMLFAALAQVLIIPTAHAVITRVANPRFFTLIFAAMSIISFAIMRIGPNLTKTNDAIDNGMMSFVVPGVILLVLGVLALIFSKPLVLNWKKDTGEA
jgi:proton-dependent oligopeptide transporter, POT family